MIKWIAIIILLLVVSTSLAATKEDLKAACPSGIKSDTSLAKVIVKKDNDSQFPGESYSYSPNLTDSCYKITSSKFIYLVDDHNAIYRIYLNYSNGAFHSALYFLDFGNFKVKYRTFEGIVKGDGLVDYKDREGLPRKMQRLKVIKEY